MHTALAWLWLTNVPSAGPAKPRITAIAGWRTWVVPSLGAQEMRTWRQIHEPKIASTGE